MRELATESCIGYYAIGDSGNASSPEFRAAVEFYMLGDFRGAERELRALEARYLGSESLVERCEVLQLLALNLISSGRPADAAGVVAELQDVAGRVASPSHGAQALICLAAVNSVSGHVGYARDISIRAKQLLSRAGDPVTLSRACCQLGHALVLLGYPDRARRELEMAVGLAESAGSAFGKARAIALLGHCLAKRGELHEALGCYREGISGYELLGARRWALQVRFNAASLECLMGRGLRVQAQIEEAFREHGSLMRGVTASRWRLVSAWSRVVSGDYQRGQAELDSVLSEFSEGEFDRDLALCHEYLGDAYLGLKDYARAEEHYEEGLKLGRMISPTSDVTLECLWKSGELLLATGRFAEALERARRALWVARVSGNRFERAAVYRLRGKIQGVRGRRKLAESLLWDAWREYSAMGAEVDAAKTRALLEGLRSSSGEEGPAAGSMGTSPGPRVLVRSPKAVRALEAEAREAGIVSADPRVLEAYRLGVKAAQTRLPVLILGETGTGKELFASLIHLRSQASRSLVAVNCAALPPDLLDAELFGHARGAFTGALRDRPGLIEEANGGTLFLDEVGEMTLPVQGRLLRAVEHGEIRRLGETRPRHISTRYVAATHRDLEEMVRLQTFRTDLYFRLQGVVISIPPLRDRVADIDLLIDHFLVQFGARLQRSICLTSAARERLRTHAWPGNVRELRSLIDRLVSLNEDGFEVDERDLGLARPRTAASLAEHLEEEERRRLTAILESVRWNQSATSRILRIKRTTLLGKMKRLGVVPPKKK